MIVCGGGAQDASAEVTALAAMLQAPVLAYRRGRGVLDGRDPLSVTLPLGRDLWGEADVVLGIGTRMLHQFQHWGIDDDLAVIRIDSDPEEHRARASPPVALIGDAAPILRRAHRRDCRPITPRGPRARTKCTSAMPRWRERLEKLAPQLAFLDAIRAELPEDGILVDEVTQIGFAARLAFPVYRPRTFLSPGYQDNLGWGYATALGAQHARPDVPVVAISGDGGFMFTANELATAVRHRIPLVAIVFNDGAFGNVRRIQAGALRQPADRLRPRQSGFRAFWRELWCRRRARQGCGGAACRVAAGHCAARRTDADRGAGRADAFAMGVHPYAEGAGLRSKITLLHVLPGSITMLALTRPSGP